MIEIEGSWVVVESVRAPKWCNGGVEMMVKFEHLPVEVPFWASPDDTEAHGRELFAMAVAKRFGNITETQVYPDPKTFVPKSVRLEKRLAELEAKLEALTK